MNPHARPPIGLLSLASSLRTHRELIYQMSKREVIGRYKGSALGLLWSLLTPLLLLAMYTFVFSVVFAARWGGSSGTNRMEFALFLFVGIIVHGLLAETMNRSPTLVLANVSYVKKVVFPLEILPVVGICASLFHACMSLVVLGLAQALFGGGLPWTWLWLPLALLPLVVLALGLSWILSSLGVFIRDIAHPIALLTTVLLFASPVFYPASAVPQEYRAWLTLNPLSFVIEQARDVLLSGRAPDFAGLAVYLLVAVAVAWAGYAWFQRTRRGFANVL